MASIRYLDFGYRDLLIEAALLGTLTNGTFSYQDLATLPFDLYEHATEAVPEKMKRLLEEKKSAGA